MFYGATVKPGASVKLNAEGGEVLHISGACLANPTSDERTYLVLQHEDKNHILCTLKKDAIENVSLDIFVPTRSGAVFKVQGKSEVHVIGYYEPLDSDDESMGSDTEGILLDDQEDGSTQISSDDEPAAPKQKKVQEVDDNGNAIDSDDDDDMDDIEDQGDENEDEDDDEDDDDDDDDEELKKALQQQLSKKHKPTLQKPVDDKKKNKVTPQQPDKKRKGGDFVSTKPEKQQKTNAQSGGATQQFEKAVAEYLKKHGKSLISQVASACPKPASISLKYREFLVSRPSVFVVEGQHAALKA